MEGNAGLETRAENLLGQTEQGEEVAHLDGELHPNKDQLLCIEALEHVLEHTDMSIVIRVYLPWGISWPLYH